MSNFSVDVNVNFPDLKVIPQLLKGIIMSVISDQLKASNDAMIAKLVEFEGKVDGLILAGSTTKDALVALQATVAGGQVATVEDLQAIIDAQTSAVTGIATKEVSVDAAAAAVAP